MSTSRLVATSSSPLCRAVDWSVLSAGPVRPGSGSGAHARATSHPPDGRRALFAPDWLTTWASPAWLGGTRSVEEADFAGRPEIRLQYSPVLCSCRRNPGSSAPSCWLPREDKSPLDLRRSRLRSGRSWISCYKSLPRTHLARIRIPRRSEPMPEPRVGRPITSKVSRTKDPGSRGAVGLRSGNRSRSCGFGQ